MPPILNAPQLTVSPQQLTQSAFASFGTVVVNPLGQDANSMPANLSASDPTFVSANQGTALKAANVSPWVDRYTQSQTHVPGRPTISLFSCFPRVLHPAARDKAVVFPVHILERHPYTTQTFVPMGLSHTDASTKYLVIVAPTLPPTERFPERGPPDLNNVQAFLAHGRQAVTYGAATWHAPMVVIGEKRVDFVVVQSTNGVPKDDCQEVEIQGDRLGVALDSFSERTLRGAKL